MPVVEQFVRVGAPSSVALRKWQQVHGALAWGPCMAQVQGCSSVLYQQVLVYT
jgi:hypothetical protein